MSTPASQAWYVPNAPAGQENTPQALVPAANTLPGEGQLAVEAAQPFTVSLEAVMVVETPGSSLHRLLHREHDVLIVSAAALGAQPPVQRVHYYADNLPLETLLADFLADAVYVCDDYSGNDRLWVELRVLDVGTDPGERETLVRAFAAAATAAGAIFPITLPYTMLARGAAATVDKFLAATKVSPLLTANLALSPPGGTGGARLRQGRYVLCHAPIDGSAYRLGDDGRLLAAADGQPAALTYATLALAASDTPSPDWVVSQRVATLLSQLDQGTPGLAQSALGAVEEAMRGFGTFRDLQRYSDLARKRQQTPGSLSPAEQALLQRLGQKPELQPYIAPGAPA
jgi:hypothetical protein